MTLNLICVIHYALKDNNNTVRTMEVTREHLDLIDVKDNVYECQTKQKSNLTLHAQDVHDSV